MASAKIGALHVELGMNSAQFKRGLAESQSGLMRFTKLSAVGWAAVGAAAASAATAMGIAFKGAINHADELSKTAARVGTTTEALSRLEWAAKLSDVSLSELATGMQRLSRNMLDVSMGAGETAKRAFDALQISVQNSDGSLRDSNEVLRDVADRFANMKDGTEKTALAMALFGRAGAQLIPMLNAGRDGMAAFDAESDRLGQTISTKTGKAAENFNDSLSRLNSGFDGVINTIIGNDGVIAAMNTMADTIADPGFQQGVIDATNLFLGLADQLARTAQLATALADILPHAVNASEDKALYNIPGYSDMIANAQAGMEGVGSGAGSFDAFKMMFGSGETAKKIEATSHAVFKPVITDAGAAAKATKGLSDQMREAQAVIDATRTPAENYTAEIEKLNRLLQAGAIDQETYNRAVLQAQDAFDSARGAADKLGQATKQTFSSIGSGLRGLIDGTRTWQDALIGVLDSLGSAVFQSIDFGKGFGGNLLSGLFGGLFGFAEGGSFKVGGSGGIDSQLVAFKASPDERVTITKPGQDFDGGGTSTVRVELADGLVASILDQAAGQTVQIVAPVAKSVNGMARRSNRDRY